METEIQRKGRDVLARQIYNKKYYKEQKLKAQLLSEMDVFLASLKFSEAWRQSAELVEMNYALKDYEI